MPAAAGDRLLLGPFAVTAAACSNADLRDGTGGAAGDPTELALLRLAAGCGQDVSLASRQAGRRQLFRFDPRLKLMTTVDEDGGGLVMAGRRARAEQHARAGRRAPARREGT